MIRVFSIIIGFVWFSIEGNSQIFTNDKDPSFQAFEEKLFVHVCGKAVNEDSKLSNYRRSKSQSRIAEHLTNYPFRKDVKDHHIQSIDEDEVVLDLVKADILAKKYSSALSILDNISVSNLRKDYKDDYQFYRGYLLFVHKDFAMSQKVFDNVRSLRTEFATSSLYYSAFCDLFTEEYVASTKKFEKLKNNKKYKYDIPYYLSILYYKQEKYDDLIPFINQSIARTAVANKESMKELLGRTYYHKEKWQLLSNHLLADNNCCTSMEQHYFVGLSLYKQKNFAEAEKHLEKASGLLSKEGQNAILALGHIIKNKDEKRAIQLFEKASQLNFDQNLKDQALMSLAILYAENNNYQNSLRNSHRITEVSQFFEQALKSDIQVYVGQKDYKKALQTILRINNPSRDLQRLYQNLLLQNGLESYSSNEIPQAKNFLVEASRLEDDKSTQKQALLWLAQMYFDQSQYQNALLTLDTYFQIDQLLELPKEASELQAKYLQAYAYLKNKQHQKAHSSFHTAEKMVLAAYRKEAMSIYEMQYEDVLLRQADCSFFLGEKEKAEKMYTKAYQQAAGHGDYALYQKGKIEDLTKEPYLQIATYEKLEDEFPNSVYLVDSQLKRGNILLKLGKSKESYDVFAKVYKSPQSVEKDRFEALMRMGLINYNQGDVESALVYYKELFNDHQLNESQVKEAITVIEEIYLNDLRDAEAYYSFLEDIERDDIAESEKDSIDFMIAYEILVNNKDEGLKRMKSYLSKYPKGTNRSNAYLEMVKTFEDLDMYDETISTYQLLYNDNEEYTKMALDGILNNQIKSQDYKGYIKTNKSIIQKNFGREETEISYARIAKASLNIKSIHLYEKEIRLALETDQLSEDQKELIKYHLAEDFLSIRQYAKATNLLKELSQSENSDISSASLLLVAQRLYDLHKLSDATIILDRILGMKSIRKSVLAQSIVLKSQIYLAFDEFDLAIAGLETIMEQDNIDINLVKKADELMKNVAERKKQLIDEESSTLELQYIPND